MNKSRFQEEFPELAAGADDKAHATQKKEDETKELQHGPGPSLRPQSELFDVLCYGPGPSLRPQSELFDVLYRGPGPSLRPQSELFDVLYHGPGPSLRPQSELFDVLYHGPGPSLRPQSELFDVPYHFDCLLIRPHAEGSNALLIHLLISALCTFLLVCLASPLTFFSWSPYVIGQTIIFLPCGFFFFLSFFSSPNLSHRRLDVCHTSTHGVALVRI